MHSCKLNLKYQKDDTIFEEKSDYLSWDLVFEKNTIKLTLKPTTNIAILKCDLVIEKYYRDEEKIFVNGYQSWSTSREYGRNDKLNGLNFLTGLSFAKKYSTISGDYLFKEYPKHKGIFHGYTYTYFKNNDKITVVGSLSEKEGFTIFNHNFNTNQFIIEKEVEGLEIDKEFPIFQIYFAEDNYESAFDGYFSKFMVKELRTKRLVGYTSWYNYFQNINEEIILRDLKGLSKVEADIFQIDDGYQMFVGDFMDINPMKFPHGMKYIADKIHSQGLLAGLWLAPFSVERKSKTYNEHKDWVLKDKNGKPILGCIGWSGAYTLDIYNEEARAYIKQFFNAVVNEWGFDMVKLDFLYSQCMIPRNGKSRGMIMCEAMEFLRECVGEKTYILGCGVPLGSAFNIVDQCRISCDVDTTYKERWYFKGLNREIISSKYAINNTIFRRHLNGRAFTNDPDVFFLREDNLKFTKEQKLLLAKINNMFGDVLFVSDNINAYNEETVQILKETFQKKNIQNVNCDINNGVIKISATIDGKEETIEII